MLQRRKPCFLLYRYSDSSIRKKQWRFFREIGIEPKIKNGYYYPASEQAASVLDVLRMEAAYTGVKEIVSCEIKAIKRQGDFFLIRTGTGDFRAKSIIFATGLFASPKSGSDGSALPYIEHFGHHIIEYCTGVGAVAVQAVIL